MSHLTQSPVHHGLSGSQVQRLCCLQAAQLRHQPSTHSQGQLLLLPLLLLGLPLRRLLVALQ
jgi:hypothetical protein